MRSASTELERRTIRDYLSENWGLIPLVAFVLFIFAALTQYNYAENFVSPPPTYAIIATLFLLLGVAIQIASHLFYWNRHR